jgi:putative tricarboxylic transport membrane protein
VLLAAMFIHDVRPGPLIMIEHPEFVYQTVAMVFLATIGMFVLGLSMVKWIVKILAVPREKLMPVIFVLCVIGSFALHSRIYEVGIMVVFGLIGFLMKEMEYPVAPLVLGIILGGILDKNLRRALVLTEGDLTPMFTRPISLVIVLLTVFTILSKMPWFRRLMASGRDALVGALRGGRGDGRGGKGKDSSEEE